MDGWRFMNDTSYYYFFFFSRFGTVRYGSFFFVCETRQDRTGAERQEIFPRRSFFFPLSLTHTRRFLDLERGSKQASEAVLIVDSLE